MHLYLACILIVLSFDHASMRIGSSWSIAERITDTVEGCQVNSIMASGMQAAFLRASGVAAVQVL